MDLYFSPLLRKCERPKGKGESLEIHVNCK